MSSQINALSQLPVLQRFIAETQEREAKSKYSKNYDYARLRFMWIMRSCLVDAGLFLVKMLKAGQQEAVCESSCRWVAEQCTHYRAISRMHQGLEVC